MDHASRFIQLYADLNDFMAAGPPPPLDRVTSAALQTMAPMAASLLLGDKRAQKQPAFPPPGPLAAAPGAVMDAGKPTDIA